MPSRAESTVPMISASSNAERAAEAGLWTPDVVASVMATAGATLLSIRDASAFPAGFKTAWPQIVRAVRDGDYPGDTVTRAPPPSAAEIADMDTVMAWATRFIRDPVRRKIVLQRMLQDPLSGRPRYSWREIGAAIHIAQGTAQSWHEQGCADIATALNRRHEPMKHHMITTR